jgi:hypothetical protein
MDISSPGRPPSAWQQTMTAARANLVPGSLLQLVALTIVVSYFKVDAMHAFLDSVAAFKAQIGRPFAMVSTGLFAGAFPLLMQGLLRDTPGQPKRKREPLALLPFYILFWAFLGSTIDAFYQMQSFIFGDDNHPLTVIKKVVCDMTLYTPFFSGPLIVIAYAWKDAGFDVGRARTALGRNWYAKRVQPMVFAAWMVWIPAVSVIYCLPLALQLPVQNVIQCLWGLILLCLNTPGETPVSEQKNVLTKATT